jgi:dipeptidyl aminopeptidase/acylaminoacyl peptidase
VIAGDESRQERVGWPRFLPDGRQFIYFFASPNAERRGIYLGSLDSTDTRLLLNSDFRAWYAPPGYLVFLRDETLMAQPFDPKRLELHGEAKPIAQGIWSARGAAQASFSVSETGVLAYVNASLWDAQLLWLDRAGRPLGAAAPAVRYEGLTPQISPDGRRVAVARGELGIQDVWILSLGGGAPERLTFTPEADGLPVWAPDSRRLMYMTRSDVGSRVFVKDVDTGEEKVLLESTPTSLFLADWSRDGSYVVFEHLQGASSDIWFARLGVESIIPTEFTATRFNETQSQLSPNGRWIAYTSNETGRDEVYVQSFPEPGRKRQVSSRGGAMPRWRADGRELYFLAGDQFLTAVPVVDQSSLELGAAQPLFLTKLIVQGSESSGLPTAYDVMPDGERFLLRYPPDNPEPPITVVLDWQAALAE